MFRTDAWALRIGARGGFAPEIRFTRAMVNQRFAEA